MRDYMEIRVTPPKRVTPPTWGPRPPCKQKEESKKGFVVTPMIELGITRTEGRALTKCAHPSSLPTTKSVL